MNLQNNDRQGNNRQSTQKKNIVQQNNNLQNNEQIRLQVYLAHCGVASRRKCEQIIEEGRVSVNGDVVTSLGTKVNLTDKICVDNTLVKLEQNKRYVLLNKPQGYVCSSSDEKNRPIAYDLIKDSYTERLYNVGRLDMYSCGLVIFTNDGEFAAKLSHPSSELEKEYIVDSNYDIPEKLVTSFIRGIRIDNVFYKCKNARLVNKRRLQVVLIEGKNREIRKVFEHFEITIKKLIRVRIGNIEMNKLPPGEQRDLTTYEVNGLLNLCKDKLFNDGE